MAGREREIGLRAATCRIALKEGPREPRKPRFKLLKYKDKILLIAPEGRSRQFSGEMPRV